jgi:hypothetical protein
VLNGPLISMPCDGEVVSAVGIRALRPSGVAPTVNPKGMLADTVLHDACQMPPFGPLPYLVVLYFGCERVS